MSIASTEKLGAGAWLKFLVIGSAGMAQFFPLMFTQVGLPAVFRARGMELEDFWMFSIPLIPYWAKVFWAPFADRFQFVGLGLRRSWILPCTLGGAASLVALGFVEPSLDAMWPVVSLLLVHAIFMSTQDVAIDAYTVENLSERERGPGVSVKIIMETLGSMAAVAGLMAVQEYFGWRTSMVLCAGLLICFTLPVLLRPEPKRGPAEAKAPRPSLIKLALRKDSRLIVGLLLLAGLVKGGLASMTGAFLVDGGLGLAEIGIVTGVVFSTGQLLGAAAGGLAMQRFGARDYARNLAFLIIPGFAPMAALAWFGSPQLWSAALAMAPAAFALAGLHLLVTTSRLGWASRSQAGTDFSAQGAVYNMGESAMAAIAGAMALRLGWPGFFLAVAAIATSAAIAFFVSHARLRDLVDARERAVGEQS